MVKTASKYIHGAMRYFRLEIITSAFQLYFIAERDRRDISHGDARLSGAASLIPAGATRSILHCLLLLCLSNAQLTYNLTVCMTVCLTVCLSYYWSYCLTVSLSNCLTICVSKVCLIVCMFLCLYVCLTVCLSDCMSVCRTVCLSDCCVYLSV